MGKIFIEQFNNDRDLMLCKNCFRNNQITTLFLKESILNMLEIVYGKAYYINNIYNIYRSENITNGFFKYIINLIVFEENTNVIPNVKVCDMFCNRCDSLVGYDVIDKISNKYILLKDRIF